MNIWDWMRFIKNAREIKVKCKQQSKLSAWFHFCLARAWQCWCWRQRQSAGKCIIYQHHKVIALHSLLRALPTLTLGWFSSFLFWDTLWKTYTVGFVVVLMIVVIVLCLDEDICGGTWFSNTFVFTEVASGLWVLLWWGWDHSSILNDHRPITLRVGK